MALAEKQNGKPDWVGRMKNSHVKGGSKTPITPTYPGVYIEEIPSGVRTITGVATSIAAFVGKGGLIWRTCCDQRFYLDGRAFGLPRYEEDADGRTLTKCDLALPSGAGEKASDFESWFSVKLSGNWF